MKFKANYTDTDARNNLLVVSYDNLVAFAVEQRHPKGVTDIRRVYLTRRTARRLHAALGKWLERPVKR